MAYLPSVTIISRANGYWMSGVVPVTMSGPLSQLAGIIGLIVGVDRSEVMLREGRLRSVNHPRAVEFYLSEA